MIVWKFNFFFSTSAQTMQELMISLQNAVDAMKSSDHPVTAIASGSELFLRFITLAELDNSVSIEFFRIFYSKFLKLN